MAKQSPGQKQTVERVMHEFKHGELTIGEDGPKVKDRRQAIVIALRESGSSNQETPAANRRNLRKTKAAERAGRTGQDEQEGTSKAALYAQAREKGIAGRSGMSKAELRKALGRASG